MPRDARLLFGSLLVVAFALWSGVFVSQAFAANFSLTVYLVASFAACADLTDFGVRLYLRQLAGRWSSPVSVALEEASGAGMLTGRSHARPYAFIVSVYNAEHDLDDFLAAMAPYRDQFWIIDDGSTDRTCERLRSQGWRCIEGGRNRRKPAALRFLLGSLPREIETVIVLDPDFAIRDLEAATLAPLEAVLVEFQRSGMAAVCPRIVIRRDGLLGRFQALEYHISFALGRRSLGAHCVNGGAAIYRRDALESALAQHTLSVYGEDLQTSIILLGEGRSIYYDGRLVLETDGKPTWRSWFSQRVGWYYGLALVYARHWRAVGRIARSSPRAAYHFGVYTGLVVLLAHPIRVMALGILAASSLNALDELFGLGWVPDSTLTDPVYMAVVVGIQTAVAATAMLIVAPRRDWGYLAPIVPFYVFYSLAHVVPVTLGYLNWLAVATMGRRVWSDHYQDEDSLRAEVLTARTEAPASASAGASSDVG